MSETVIRGNGWTGAWIALALLLMSADWTVRADCALGVSKACVEIAQKYEPKSEKTQAE